jgi:hypothetical protein
VIPTACDDHALIEHKTLTTHEKSTSSTEAVCTYPNRTHALISKKCASSLDSCLGPIYEKKDNLKGWSPIEEYGNPTFQLCSFLGGDPQFIRYKMYKGDFRPTTICIFKSANIVTDLDSLYASYLRIVKSN